MGWSYLLLFCFDLGLTKVGVEEEHERAERGGGDAAIIYCGEQERERASHRWK